MHCSLLLQWIKAKANLAFQPKIWFVSQLKLYSSLRLFRLPGNKVFFWLLDILDEIVFSLIEYTFQKKKKKKRQVFSNVGSKSLNKEYNKLTKLKTEFKKKYMQDWIFLSLS